jgi:hypothetical protein
MSRLTALPLFTAGQLIHQHQLNTLSDDLDQLCRITQGKPAASGVAGKPLVKVILSGSQNVVSGADNTTMIAVWGAEVADTDGMWTPGAGADHLTINTAGWYRIVAQAQWSSGAASERVVQILVNGVADPLNVTSSSNELPATTGTHRHQVVAYEHLAAGATVYCGIWQNSGSTLQLLTNGTWGTYMTAAWAAPY